MSRSEVSLSLSRDMSRSEVSLSLSDDEVKTEAVAATDHADTANDRAIAKDESKVGESQPLSYGAVSSDGHANDKEARSKLPKPPIRVVPAWLYVIATCIISALISGGLTALIAYLLYRPYPEEVRAWAFPHPLFGDLIVTTIVLWVATWMIGTHVALRDLIIRHPIAVRRSSMPRSWADAFRRTPLFIPLCFNNASDGSDSDSDEPKAPTAAETSRSSLARWFSHAVSHDPPLTPPLIDGDEEAAAELLPAVLESLASPDGKAPGEPLGQCLSVRSLRSELLAVVPFIVATEILVALPLAGLITIRGTEAGLWTLNELILLKGLYGGLLELPVAWIIVVSVILWYEKRRERLLGSRGLEDATA